MGTAAVTATSMGASTAMDIALVALGGALGATLRYLTERVAARMIPSAFPWGILIANVVGSFVLGVLLSTVDGAWLVFAGVGFCGAFTTYSTFAHDTVRLRRAGRGGVAVANVIASITLAVIAVSLGLALGSVIAG